MDVLRQLRNEYRNIMFLSKQRKRLVNKDICLIASNCNGAMILHDLRLQFKSPFVNLWLRPKDFKVVAKSEDGIVEAIENKNIIAVQWHPEYMNDIKFFEYFINKISNKDH